MGATFLKKYHKISFWKRGNDALFSFPKRKKFQKRSWQPCRLIAFDYGEKSPRNSSQKPTQAWIFCSAQGCCAARGSFGIFHQTVILRFAHGAQTGRKIFPQSYLAPNKKSKHFHRTWWDKIPHGGASGSVGAPSLHRSFPRVRNKPSACRPCGNADTSRLTLSGGRGSKRSSGTFANFFFATFFLFGKEKS